MKTQELKNNLHSFLALMNTHVESYLRYALQYPFITIKVKKRVLRFFKHLFLVRSEEFIRQTKCKESGIENKTLDQVRDGFIKRLNNRLPALEKTARNHSRKPPPT